MSAIFDRWCSRGQHFCKPDSFRPAKTKQGPGLARDCLTCEAAAAEGAALRERIAPPPAVDIDRIHRRPPRWWEGKRS